MVPSILDHRDLESQHMVKGGYKIKKKSPSKSARSKKRIGGKRRRSGKKRSRTMRRTRRRY